MRFGQPWFKRYPHWHGKGCAACGKRANVKGRLCRACKRKQPARVSWWRRLLEWLGL